LREKPAGTSPARTEPSAQWTARGPLYGKPLTVRTAIATELQAPARLAIPSGQLPQAVKAGR
jgi:hypothetical protein